MAKYHEDQGFSMGLCEATFRKSGLLGLVLILKAAVLVTAMQKKIKGSPPVPLPDLLLTAAGGKILCEISSCDTL
ncbi:hypothetical protein XENTR_v10016397 [Xenopus tropicalis]|nr:hypothetical protein XENTR_v10016397 [Xenopus tropicalis]